MRRSTDAFARHRQHCLVGHGRIDPYGGRALRLFAVQLLLCRGAAASHIVAAGNPDLSRSLPNTVLLLASSVAVWWGEHGTRRGRRGPQLRQRRLPDGRLLIVQFFEWKAKTYLNSSVYGSLFFTVTGFHMAHVLVGLSILLAVRLVVARLFRADHTSPVSVGVIYWHFVDAVWILVFFTFYITPYLGLRHG